MSDRVSVDITDEKTPHLLCRADVPMNPAADATRLRRTVYAVLITVAAGAAAGRIAGVENVYEPSLFRAAPGERALRGDWPAKRPPAMPTFGSNDRSRWATVRALVDHGTFHIGERDRSLLEPSAASFLAATNPLEAVTLWYAGRDRRIASTRAVWQQEGPFDPAFDTVDKVLDPATQKFYSSKPPLLATLVAGIYWLLQQLTGWTMANNIWAVVKTILLLINVVPFVIYLVLLALLAERFARSDWARVYLVAAGCFATLVTPFLVTFNNHTIGTFSVMFALFPALQILCGGPAGEQPAEAATWRDFALAGFFASFAATCELPALAFLAGLGLILLVRAPLKTLLAFVPAAALPLAALLLTNYLEIGQLQPAYAKFGTIWYEYEGSHWGWLPGTRTGIDYARHYESRAAYVVHVLLGHHGLFSLTPIWLPAFVGMMLGSLSLLRNPGRQLAMLRGRDSKQGEHATSGQALPAYFYAAALLLSVIVITFYLTEGQRNYGGWTAGLRWLMWLTPVWLLCLIPALDRMAMAPWARWLGYGLLALSVLSAAFPAWNPWRHPWIFRWMDAQGWIPY